MVKVKILLADLQGGQMLMYVGRKSYILLVKEAKIVKVRDTPDAACILLTVEVSSKK